MRVKLATRDRASRTTKNWVVYAEIFFTQNNAKKWNIWSNLRKKYKLKYEQGLTS